MHKTSAQRGVSHALVVVVVVCIALVVAVYFTQHPTDVKKEELQVSKESTSFHKLFEKGETKEEKNICYSSEEYERKTYPVLSLPFDPKDYSTKYWGMVPFCAKLRNGQIHGAFDYELKPNSKIYSATDGVVQKTEVGKAEGSGEIVAIQKWLFIGLFWTAQSAGKEGECC